MNRNKKLTLQLLTALLLVVVGCGLLVAGFIVNPLGVIDATVLTAFGETCTFGGALFGIDYTYRYKTRLANLDNSSSEHTEQ